MTGRLRTRAPGKVNLCLFLGPTRPDGRHELVSVVESLSLADELELTPAGPGARGDEVVCAGVAGPNLASAALAAYREATGWDDPPVRLEIDKRVPVAAGMGGGSGDAAAALRLAAHAAGRHHDPVLARLAPVLGADVSSQLAPGLSLMTGAGERVVGLPPLAAHAVLVVPAAGGLSTADVYREADRLGLGRPAEELAALESALARALGAPGAELPDELVHNDLQVAACSLRPAVDRALADARAVGARHVLVSGSGPTVVGLFPGADGEAHARAAAAGLRDRHPGACVALAVGPEAGWVRDGER